MAITRVQHEAIWLHLLTVVLRHTQDDNLWTLLNENGIDNVTDLMGEPETADNMSSWEYEYTSIDASGDPIKDPSGNPVLITYKIKRHEVNQIFILKDYIWKDAVTRGFNASAQMQHEHFMALTREGFDIMRTDPNYTMRRERIMVSKATTTTTTPSTQSTSNGNNNWTPVEQFKRSIKRDMSLFPQLKSDDHFERWNRTTVTQANIQDVAEVLDPNYKAIDKDDKALFQRKQTYMYGVFELNLLTDKGKAVVRKHEDDRDAQKVYKDVKTHYTDSVKARIDSEKYLQYITTARYDETWSGTALAFVIHWQEQIRLYNALVPKSSKYTGNARLHLLQSAVSTSDELRKVYQTAQQLQSGLNKVMDYDEYVTLLQDACSQLDGQLKPKTPKPLKSQRGIYQQEIEDGISGITEEPTAQLETYSIDTPIRTIDANFVRRKGASMTKVQWERLSKTGQDNWDKLDDNDKSIILEPRPPLKPSTQPTSNQRRKPYNPNFQRNINASDIDLSTISVADYLQMQASANESAPSPDAVADDGNDGSLLTFISDQLQSVEEKKHPANLQRMMSSDQSHSTGARARGKPPTTATKTNPTVNTIQWAGRTWSANLIERHNVKYKVSQSCRSKGRALVDRGANGGVAGNDVYIVNRDIARKVDITGVENHQVKDIHLGTVAAMVQSSKGPVIVVSHQQALLCKGASILSSIQMEAAGCDVNDKSIKLAGGKQRIIKDGYILPITIQNGLPRMKMRACTETEYHDVNIPHLVLTDDIEWDPTVLDNDDPDDIEWFDAHQEELPDVGNLLFDNFGEYKRCTVVNKAAINDTFLAHQQELEEHVIPVKDLLLETYPTERRVDDSEIDFEALRPNFAWQPADIVKRTFECTTQYGRLPMGDRLAKQYRSPHPALNTPRRDEDVATDTVFSDTPAIDNGSTIAQFYCGTESLVCDVYGVASEKQFVNTLQENIRKRGAMNRLISDRAQVEISSRVLDVLRALCIGDWQSEPLQQHQNPAERRWQTVKRTANTIMSRTGSPAYTWLLALLYVCFVLNHSASASLNHNCPMNVLYGRTSDCSPLLRFQWWQLLEYKLDDSDFPSDSPTLIGHFVGFSVNVGHPMTVKILTLDTKKIIHRGNVRSAENQDTFNWRAITTLDGEDVPEIIKSVREKATGLVFKKEPDKDDDDNQEIKAPSAPIIPISTLIGRTFLMDEQDDGQRHRARIIKAINDDKISVEKQPDRMKFLCSVNDDEYEEILSYSELMEHIEGQEDDDRVWKFKRITSHEGPLKPDHSNYKGSKFNVMMEWENGEITSEPLAIIAADDPVTCAIYANDNDLLETPGWKRFKGIARRQKKMFRMTNQAKLRSFRTAPKYMYGYEIPRDYKHALELDDKNGNREWRKCTILEFDQLDEYDTFIDLEDGHPGKDFKKIRVHLVYAAKHDGRHKARCVADGHLTDIPVDSVYSGVVSLRGIRMLLFLAELNGLETWGTDVGNAYLEARTSERVYVIAGPEFGDREGHVLVIFKALYGLRSSGLRWHERFSAVLRGEGFVPCKMEPDLWLRENGNVYEYIAVYVDDLAFSMKDPKAFTTRLVDFHKFKLKGTGPIEYHLGCDFERDEDDTLCMHPKKYIQRMIDGYERMFGEKPNSRVRSPLEENDHPEMDSSDFLGPDDIAKYQSLVGSMQWAISLGRIDIATACMTLSGYRSCPRTGHLERAKRVIGYLSRMTDAKIRFRTQIPDYSDLPGFEYNWDLSIYGDVEEEVPDDAPKPLGKPVSFTHYVDANLYHDMLTGRSVTGILHFVNQTPIDWYSKKQNRVETATYGSEFMAARTAVEKILDLRLTFRYLGVPIQSKSYMFGDNEAVVNSAAKIDSKLHKRHNALSFHRVREAIASRMVDFFHIPGKQNPADILSKHWSYGKTWQVLQPLLFWSGDTNSIKQKQ